jgi:hypothetical protein
VRPGKAEVLERERAWALPVAVATLASVALLVAATIVVRSISGEGEAEVLRSAHEHSSTLILSGVLQAVAFLLLLAPLLYLFRAVEARSEKVRAQLIGLVIATPIFLSGAAIMTAVSTDDAASEFVAGKASADLTRVDAAEECRSQLSDDAEAFREDFGRGAAALRLCTGREIADDAAENAVADAPLRGLSTGLGLGGRLGLAFALLYSCLWAMRSGLLTRFWGSLGMAMGVAALLLLIQFTFVWFLYFGLLVAGWLPGGRPPAWAAGEAIPWPTPGEKAAEELEDDPPEEREPR